MSVKPVAGNVDRCGELESLALSIFRVAKTPSARQQC